MQKIMYLIAGANGSGKTTLADELLEEKKLVSLNADAVAANIGDKIGIAAGKVVLNDIDTVITTGRSFAWESTISGNHHLRVIEKARNAGYEIVFVYVFLDFPMANIARIKKRVALGGHDIPDQDVIRRFYKSISNFSKVKGLSDQWELYYNGDDNYELIARGTFRATEILNEDLYEKFQGIKYE